MEHIYEWEIEESNYVDTSNDGELQLCEIDANWELEGSTNDY